MDQYLKKLSLFNGLAIIMCISLSSCTTEKKKFIDKMMKELENIDVKKEINDDDKRAIASFCFTNKINKITDLTEDNLSWIAGCEDKQKRDKIFRILQKK